MTISYDYGAGGDLSHAMAGQAALLSQHADDLLTQGKALVAENLVGNAGEAYLGSLTRLCRAVHDIGDTIVRHSGAVNNSFGGMHATDIGNAQNLSM